MKSSFDITLIFIEMYRCIGIYYPKKMRDEKFQRKTYVLIFLCQCRSQFRHYLLRMMLQIRIEDHYQITKRLSLHTNLKRIKISNLRITFCKSKRSTQQAKAYMRGSLKLQFSICHLFEAFAEQS